MNEWMNECTNEWMNELINANLQDALKKTLTQGFYMFAAQEKQNKTRTRSHTMYQHTRTIQTLSEEKKSEFSVLKRKESTELKNIIIGLYFAVLLIKIVSKNVQIFSAADCITPKFGSVTPLGNFKSDLSLFWTTRHRHYRILRNSSKSTLSLFWTTRHRHYIILRNSSKAALSSFGQQATIIIEFWETLPKLP